MKEKSASQELREIIQKKWDELQEWLKPKPEDGPWMQVLKSIYKSLVVLLLVALSPVIMILLLIAFIGVL